MNEEAAKRTVVKTVSWRILATLVAFLVLWIYTGRISSSLDGAVVVGVFNTIAYYVHERFWNRISWGRRT